MNTQIKRGAPQTNPETGHRVKRDINNMEHKYPNLKKIKCHFCGLPIVRDKYSDKRGPICFDCATQSKDKGA